MIRTHLRRAAAALRRAHATGTDDALVRRFLEHSEDPWLWAHSHHGADPTTHARLRALARRLTAGSTEREDALVLSHAAEGDFFHGGYQRGGRIVVLLYFPRHDRGFAYALLTRELIRFRLRDPFPSIAGEHTP